jgi:hypothetical protein
MAERWNVGILTSIGCDSKKRPFVAEVKNSYNAGQHILKMVAEMAQAAPNQQAEGVGAAPA